MMTRILLAVGLVAAGATGMYVYMAPGTRPPEQAAAVPVTPAEAEPAGSRTLALAADVVERAGIVAAPATTSAEGGVLRVPGIVEPDAYRTVAVTPIVGGTVVSVSVVLGDVVAQGDPVARLRSPQLTDEARRWLTGRAALDAAVRRLERTRQLAKIGAASQEELEAVEAEHVRASTEVDTARARLARLGLDEASLARVAEGESPPEMIEVRAPATGVVIGRSANPGLNVGEADSLITLADVRHVWVMADVFERDLGAVRVGQRVTVTSDALGGRDWPGRVAYVDPELSRDTRTARVRVEVDNPDAALRFGMYVTAVVAPPRLSPRVIVPEAAVQTIGAVSVVYVAAQGRPHAFVERAVLLGSRSGAGVEIRSGVSEGEDVVVAGSFFLRAERDRLGWPLPAPLDVPALPSPSAPTPGARPVIRRVVEITAAGLVPARVAVPAHEPVDLVFIRRVEETCGTELVIPALDVRRELPLNEEVVIRLAPRDPGDVTFTCGMDMLRGTIVVRTAAAGDES